MGSKHCLVLSSMQLCSVEAGLRLVDIEQIDFGFVEGCWRATLG